MIVGASVGKPWALLASLPHKAQDVNIIVWLRGRWYTCGPLLGLLPSNFTIKFYPLLLFVQYIIQVVVITHLGHVLYSRTLWDEYSSYATYNYTYNHVIDIYCSLVVNRETKSIHLTNIPTKFFGNLAKKKNVTTLLDNGNFKPLSLKEEAS